MYPLYWAPSGLLSPRRWGNMDHFSERLASLCSQDHSLAAQRTAGDVCFMPGWSAFAESADAAHACTKLGLVHEAAQFTVLRSSASHNA